MSVGIFVFQTNTSVDSAILAKYAEDLGFESFWVLAHAIIPLQTASPYPGSADGIIPDEYGRIVDPFIALARASAATQTIKLDTGICLVPEHNPLHLAKVIALLDHSSGGRFIFGIGAGWLKEETELMGGDFPHRWTQARDAVLAMRVLWTQEEAEYRGPYYDFPPVRSFPKPAQKPHPPSISVAKLATRSNASYNGAMVGCPTAPRPRKSAMAAILWMNWPKKPAVSPVPSTFWPLAMPGSLSTGSRF